MNNKKFIISIFAVFFCYLLILSLYSCNKENPVIPPEPPPPPIKPDTVSRYIWTFYGNIIPMFYIYTADTNIIYVTAAYQLAIYNGVNLTHYDLHDPNFAAENVYGFDKNNIFVAGFSIVNNLTVPTFKKITNGNIETYILENENDYIYDIFITGPNQAWFSVINKSNVYYFDNGIINKFRLSNNDSINIGKFYLDKNKNLYVFASKFLGAPIGTLYTYKFNSDHFDSLRTDCINLADPTCKNPNIFRCGTDAVMLPYNTHQKLYYFNGSDWIIHSSMDSIMPFKIGGISRDSLVAIDLKKTKLYTYGGSKWRYENDSPILAPTIGYQTNIEAKFGNIYLANSEQHSGPAYILIGKPNKNFKNFK